MDAKKLEEGGLKHIKGNHPRYHFYISFTFCRKNEC